MTRGLLRCRPQSLLWLGPRRATATTITCVHGPARTPTLSALLEAARRSAAAQHLVGAVWPYLSGAQALEAAACHPLAQAVLHTADTFLTVPAGGMRALEDAARSAERRKWRQERARFSRAATMEWCPAASPLDAID